MKPIESLVLEFLVALRCAPKGSRQWSELSAQRICGDLKFSGTEYKSVIDYSFTEGLIEMTNKDADFLRVRLGRNADNWMRINDSSKKSEGGWLQKILPSIISGLVLLVLGAVIKHYWP